MKRTSARLALGIIAAAMAILRADQPKVNPGPGEPDWEAILTDRYGLSMRADLANPVVAGLESVPGLFRKAGPGSVRFRPEIALGLEATIAGGWYPATAPDPPTRRPLWSYRFKNTADDFRTGRRLPPPLLDGSTIEFDPGDAPFGLIVENDQFKDFVATEPARVRRGNARLASQPYKVMIYPMKDATSGRVVPRSYLIGWEYSTNDDFQDVVTRVDNVELLPPPR